MPDGEIPQQHQLSKSVDAEALLDQVAKILNCTLEDFQKAARVSPSAILDRNLLIFLLWQSGRLANYKIAGKFGLIYSAVSRRVGIFRNLSNESTGLQNKLNQIKSLIKI